MASCNSAEYCPIHSRYCRRYLRLRLSKISSNLPLFFTTISRSEHIPPTATTYTNLHTTSPILGLHPPPYLRTRSRPCPHRLRRRIRCRFRLGGTAVEVRSLIVINPHIFSVRGPQVPSRAPPTHRSHLDCQACATKRGGSDSSHRPIWLHLFTWTATPFRWQ